MLIRTPPLQLERRRVPVGPVRANRDHPLYTYCQGLWLWSPSSYGVDLMGITPPLTISGTALLRSSLEGSGLDCSSANSDGASTTFTSTSPLYITSGHGLTTFVRATKRATPGTYATVFGIDYDSNANPYAVSVMAFDSDTNHSWYWNTSGTFRSDVSTTTVLETPRSYVLSHTFSTSVVGYAAGAQSFSDSVNTAAPTYGTNPILIFGRDGINAVNSASVLHICAIFARGLTAQEAIDLEANPYALIEPVRTWTYFHDSGVVAGQPFSKRLGGILHSVNNVGTIGGVRRY